MKKKPIIISGIFIVSSLIQLITQILITRLFGASQQVDNFLAAVTIPTWIVTVIYATLNDALLPRLKKDDNQGEVRQDLTGLLISLGGMGVIISLVLWLLAEWLMKLVFGNAVLDLVEVINYFRIMIWGIPIAIITVAGGSYYYLHQKLFRFPIVQLIGSVTNLLVLILTYPLFGIRSLVIGFLANLVIQLPMMWPRIVTKFKFFNLSPLLLAWLPLIIGVLAMRSDSLLVRSFGAGLGEGYLVYLNLLLRIFGLGTGLLTIGLQVVLLPNLVEMFERHEYQTASQLINKAKAVALVVTIAATAMIYWLTPELLKQLFVGGQFDMSDLQKTVELLPIFILPAIGWGVANLFAQPLIALKKVWWVGGIQLASLVCGWLVAMTLQSSGFAILSIGAGLTILLFGGIIGNEIVWQIYKKRLLSE